MTTLPPSNQKPDIQTNNGVNPNEDLESLGKQCLDAATQLKSELLSLGKPLPSFSPDGPEAFPSNDPKLDRLRNQLREVAKTLYELASNPEDVLTRDLHDKIHDMNAFAYISKYNVAESIPADGSISYTELAAKTQTGYYQLRKALRHLMTLHVFTESNPEHVGHTAASKRFHVRGVKLYNDFLCRDTFKMAVSQIDAIDKWGHDSATANQAAHNIGNNTDQNFFDYIRGSSFRSETFAELMAYLFKTASRGNERLLGLYDWTSLGNCTMVDVGGSTGHCSVFVARSNPAINFIVQDLPHVVARSSAPETSTVPLDLRNRISFQAHNIREPQPVVAEVYFLRMILHDWSDPECEKVLGHLAAAMEKKPGSRLLIVDSILPRPGTLPTVVERPMRAADMQMGLVFNGKERHYEEWETLLHRGHPLLAIKRVVQEDQGSMAIIEVSLE